MFDSSVYFVCDILYETFKLLFTGEKTFGAMEDYDDPKAIIEKFLAIESDTADEKLWKLNSNVCPKFF